MVVDNGGQILRLHQGEVAASQTPAVIQDLLSPENTALPFKTISSKELDELVKQGASHRVINLIETKEPARNQEDASGAV
ncbi:MAG: hypothetical protein HC834_03795, partial [Rhodospirillales bacterium]|nr:hypothetical protein [Rhodospirillales bacterium]